MGSSSNIGSLYRVNGVRFLIIEAVNKEKSLSAVMRRCLVVTRGVCALVFSTFAEPS